LVDIESDTFNIDASAVSAAVTDNTRAIMPVHLFGLAADMKAIVAIAREIDVPVIEDAAQAIGARYEGRRVGALGDFGCFSFFPSKNLGGAGDGGIITVQDREIGKRLRMLRTHGSPQKYRYELVGMNSRLDTLQAAILRVKLKYLDVWSEARRRNAERYRELFEAFNVIASVTLPVVPPGREHVFNQFVIRTPRRDELVAHLRKAGIPVEIYYPYPLHLENAYAYLGHKPGDFPNAETASREVLALPIYPELTLEQQTAVVKNISDFYRGAARQKSFAKEQQHVA
jgi:dTDP-4-amino-4,6-dideoxygalactose transaminase